MYQMFLNTPNGLIPTGERYDNLADTKDDYPNQCFDVYLSHGKLIAVVKTNKKEQKTMKPMGSHGWCY